MADGTFNIGGTALINNAAGISRADGTSWGTVNPYGADAGSNDWATVIAAAKQGDTSGLGDLAPYAQQIISQNDKIASTENYDTGFNGFMLSRGAPLLLAGLASAGFGGFLGGAELGAGAGVGAEGSDIFGSTQIGGFTSDVGQSAAGYAPGTALGQSLTSGVNSLGQIASDASSILGPSGSVGTFGDPAMFTPGAGADLTSAFGGPAGAGAGTGFGSLADNLAELWKKYQGLTKSPLGTAFNIGSGLYGLLQGRNLQKLASTAADRQDPFASQRGQYQQQLADLVRTGDVTKLPGYAAGLQAVNRSQAAGGYLGSGNQVLADATYGTNLYNSTVAQLGGLAGAGFGPGGAGNTLLAGNTGSLQLTGNALNRIGLGLSSMTT